MKPEPCRLCKLLERDCPAIQEIAPDDFQQITPFSQWETASEIAERYNYHPRHIIRIIGKPANQIVSVNRYGRWFILRCSFEMWMIRSGKF